MESHRKHMYLCIFYIKQRLRNLASKGLSDWSHILPTQHPVRMALLLTFWKSTFFYIIACSFSTSITMLCTDISHLNIKFMTFKSNYQSPAFILAFRDICKKFGQLRSGISYLEILLSINQTSKWKENTDDKKFIYL